MPRKLGGHCAVAARGGYGLPLLVYRNGVERLWAQLQKWRTIAVRRQRTAQSLKGMLRPRDRRLAWMLLDSNNVGLLGDSGPVEVARPA
jgi:hypothetical protein